MGLLDDAIREHLELKRKHGAPVEEVAQQEHEALGPARRADVSGPPPEAELEGEAPAPVEEPPLEPAPEPVAEAPAPVEERPAEEPWFDERDEVPADEALDHGPVSQPTTEFVPEDVEDEPAQEPAAAPADYVAPDEEPDSEDVLEETPDFLQETPEHDRLWFEQKPPKDFDFDK